MRIITFRSIRNRLIIATTLLSVILVGATVWIWARTETNLYRQKKVEEALRISRVLSNAYTNELHEKNWKQIRLHLDLLLKEESEFFYIIVSDHRQQNKIVASSPGDFQNQYIPDIVPLKVTSQALSFVGEDNRIQETIILRDIKFLKKIRGYKGEKVMDVASNINLTSGGKIGTLRVGISLKRLEENIANLLRKALMVGSLGLGFGWGCALILAKELSDPLKDLQQSANKIAAGDLQHRANSDTNIDEFSSLAIAFNKMARSLHLSFHKLNKTVESFERFVPDKFINAIAQDGIENIQVGQAVTKTVTILFCDIRGYTLISEAMTPQETFIFLNDYLACMGEAIETSGGFIDKYIGDAIMALFDGDSTDNALHAAIAMQKSLDRFNQKRNHKGLPSIRVGIGIHRGEVVMGTIGFTSRIESTVIGDAVNLASRVEGLTKFYQTSILITQAVVTALENPKSFCISLVDDFVKVKGKEEAIAIYKLDNGRSKFLNLSKRYKDEVESNNISSN